MAKLLKHLGLGSKKGSSASPRIECDRIRQSPNNDSPVVSPYKPQSSQQCASSPKQPAADTSIASTVSSTSSGGNAALTDEFPCPPSSWFNSAECSSANDDFKFKAAPNIHPDFGNKTEEQIKKTNIYENEEVSHNSKSNALFQEQCWEDIKKWLIEMTNPVRFSSAQPSTPVSTDYQVSQRDKENAAFLSEILTALQYARSEVLKNNYYNKSNANNPKDINHYMNNSSARQQQTSADPIKIGGILNEVAMKLESQYESARMSFGSKDYERYTQLKLLLQTELQEPVYGIKKQTDNFKDTFNCSYSNSDNEADENLPQNHIIPLKTSPQPTAQMRSSGFYEDAWDKDQAAEALQDQFNDDETSNNLKNGDHGDKDEKGNQGTKDPDKASNEGSHKRCDVTTNEEIDMRTRQGYDVPWDWQPHKKDGRCQEGYEKPWDLKPQDKDDRSSKDYEDPWDKNNVHTDLFVAKLAKDVKSTGNMRQANRRGKEYEEPWDRKEMDMEVVTAKLAKETLGNKTSNLPNNDPTEHDKNCDLDKHNGDRCYVNDKCGDPGAKMAFKQPSPLNKPMQPLPSIPSSLHDQPWYHGEISRSSAEEVLKRAKVASYLVRKATKGHNEYSLSVKNTNGFVHLKITTDPNHHFILGLFSQPFTSIPLMVQYYSNNKLPIKGADHISLLHPLHRLS